MTMTNQRKMAVGLLAVPTILLVAMGLVYCWVTPANTHLHGPGSHFFFSHQLCWTVNAVLLAALAYLTGWKRWLKAAPFIAIGWTALVVYSATCPLVNGRWGWISLGCIRINVLEFLPVVFSLLIAWFVHLLRLHALVGVGIVALMVGVVMGYRLVGNPIERDQFMLLPSQQKMAEKAGKPSQVFLQNQCVGAIKEAHWFGKSSVNTSCVPEGTTTSMPAVASVLFGKWYLIALTINLGLLGLGVGLFWVMGASESMRAYALVWGGLALLPAFLNLLGCVGVISMLNVGIPFASYGGSLAMSTALGLSILVSKSQGGEDRVLTGKTCCWVGSAIAAITIVVLWGILTVSCRDFTFIV